MTEAKTIILKNPPCAITFQNGKQKLHAIGGCPGLGARPCNRVVSFGEDLCPHHQAIVAGRLWTKEHPRGMKPMQVYAREQQERRRA